jgi:hypothetical protein
MARGADPRTRLPFDPARTVLGYAAAMKSPMLAVLDPPAAAPTLPVRQTARFDPQKASR